jgi:hypothetical protein
LISHDIPTILLFCSTPHEMLCWIPIIFMVNSKESDRISRFKQWKNTQEPWETSMEYHKPQLPSSSLT